MPAYYNEKDPYAAQWLRNLIAQNLIAAGDVDERSITDVQADDLRGYTQCHFFAGIGGWSYALRLAGWSDTRPVWTGSCPCQPFAQVGKRGVHEDARHLWPTWFGLIREHRPAEVLGEQVTSGASAAWLDAVGNDMETLGYAFGAASLCSAAVRRPMDGARFFWVSALSADGLGGERPRPLLQARSTGPEWPRGPEDLQALMAWPMQDGECHPQPLIRLAHDGLSPGVVKARTKGAGNAIVPQVAAAFIRAYCDVTHHAP